MKRRTFLGASGLAAASALMTHPEKLFGQERPDLVVVRNGEPASLVREAVQALGGMSRFVGKGDIVVVKPNMSWDRAPEQGANTNPQVVAEVIRLCLDAGAKKVKVFDRTLNEPIRCYRRSGIEEAARQAGAEVSHIFERKFRKVSLPSGELLRSWEFYDECLDADVFINIPAAKHHSISGVSLGMKNIMGLLGGNRGTIHRDYDKKIADLNTAIKPKLVLLDAYRILKRNGPSGGNLADVEVRKTLVAGIDPVAIDSYGVTLFDRKPAEIAFLSEAVKRGLGTTDLSKLNIRTIELKA